MILVREKDCHNDVKSTDALAFNSMSRALHYAATWIEVRPSTCVFTMETWQKKVKFGIIATYDNGEQDKMTLEEIITADPD